MSLRGVVSNALPFVAALTAIVLAPPGGARGQEPSIERELEVVGMFDPDWSVRRPDGMEIPLNRWEGEVLVVNFWATWCPPCVAELGSFARLESELDARGARVRFLLVSPEDPEVVAEFERRHDIGIELLTEARRAPDSLGEIVLPTTFVVDRRGRIVLKHRGASDWGDPAVVDFLSALAR